MVKIRFYGVIIPFGVGDTKHGMRSVGEPDQLFLVGAQLFVKLFGKGGEDALGQCADSFDGVKSAMIGIAANKSMKEGGRVDLKASLDKMR
mgnify:CR=1 FL=1